MSQVKEKKEEEFDYYLSVANLYDEGFPSVPHEHCETDSVSPSHHYGITEKSDTTPEECVPKNAPSVVGSKEIERHF